MPTLQRYNISSSAPVAPLDDSQARVSESAAQLADNLSKMAMQIGDEIGVPIAREKGAEEGADLGWKPKGGIGAVAQAYDEAARRANDHAIEISLRKRAERISTDLQEQPDSFAQFPSLYGSASTELLKGVSPERRRAAMTMRDEIADEAVEKLRNRAVQIAQDHVAGQYLNNLETLSREAANLAGSTDAASTARLRQIEAQFEEAAYYAAGQPIDANGKPVPVGSVLNVAKDKDGKPINPFADGKVVLKTGAVIPYAKLADIRQKFADGQYEAATMRAFDAAMKNGTGTAFISAFRESKDVPLSLEDRTRLQRQMFSQIRQEMVARKRDQQAVQKEVKADYEAQLAQARAVMMNPEAFPDQKVTADDYREFTKNAWLSPNAYDEFTTAWNTHWGGRDDDQQIAAVRDKIRSFDPDGAEDLVETLRLNGKISSATAADIEREVRSVREQVDNGPLAAPGVKATMDDFESRLKFSMLGAQVRSRGRSTVPDAMIDATRARIHSELQALPPARWEARAKELTDEALNALPTKELVAALTRPGEETGYEPSVMLPPTGRQFVRKYGDTVVFDAPAYSEDAQQLAADGTITQDEADLRLALAQRWRELQSANPNMKAVLDASEQKARLRVEARAQQKLGNPLTKEQMAAMAAGKW